MDHDPEDAVAVLEPSALGAAFEDVDLLPENQVLHRKAGSVSGEGTDHGQQVHDELHAAA